MNIIQVHSPNFHTGRRGFLPEAIVIHIMEGTIQGTDSWFSSTISQVSAHYGVAKNGDVHQFVEEANTAFHAGRVNAPSWSLIKQSGNAYINPNFYTIGIEHEGSDDSDWTEAMYETSSTLLRDISGRWGIPLNRVHVIGHHEIYSLKTCPGNKVDLNKLIAKATQVPYTPPSGAGPLKILELGRATTLGRLNIRVSPDMDRAPLNTVDAGVLLSYDGYTDQGQSINGNSKWYYTAGDNWFWSGGVGADPAGGI